jgi:hypothetical protein
MVSSLWLVAVTIPAAVLLLIGIYWLLRRRITPEEMERRRRLAVNASGRITDGLITEAQLVETPTRAASHLLHFSYTLNGVAYSAAQDITALLAHIDRDPHRLAGPASVKYLPDNPSNSIVICEGWSGIAGVRLPSTGGARSRKYAPGV